MSKYVIHTYDELPSKGSPNIMDSECFVCEKFFIFKDYLFIGINHPTGLTYVSRVCSETCANIWLLKHVQKDKN